MSTDTPGAAPSEADWNVALIRRVAVELMAHDEEHFAKLDVTAVGGVVTLRGTLVGEELRDRAVSVARGTRGVHAVIDRLTLRAAPRKSRPVEIVTLTSPPVREPWWQRKTVPVVLLAIVAAIGAHTWSCAATPTEPTPPQPLVQVEGTAWFDGKPAIGARLTFHPFFAVDGVTERPTAIVGPDGRFLVGTYSEADGAPVGPYVVTLEYRSQPEGQDPEREPST